MKIILILLLNFIIHFLFSDDIYKFRMIFSIQPTTINLPDGSIFQIVSGKGGFTDNRGNFGDILAHGTREADMNNNLLDTNVLFVVEKDKKINFGEKQLEKIQALMLVEVSCFLL